MRHYQLLARLDTAIYVDHRVAFERQRQSHYQKDNLTFEFVWLPITGVGGEQAVIGLVTVV